ncbi:hypothetical protein [Streptomyces sp. NBC_00459]|uniref:hypothetical protein n=1 Tax=Streptomyces sp. NBC_00459 TaxID=2975749 RepID=UPI002E19F348
MADAFGGPEPARVDRVCPLEVGIAATAEVIGLTEWEDDDSAGLTVGLPISGPGFRTFGTTWKRSADPVLRMGLRLPAVVDPARNLFRLEV